MRVFHRTSASAEIVGRSRRRDALLVLVVTGLLWPATARAQQPFSTDDADVTSKGWVHVEAFNEYDWLQPSLGPHLRQNTTNMRVNYGLGNSLGPHPHRPPFPILTTEPAPRPRHLATGAPTLA